MERITRCPGVVAVERYTELGYVRWEPAAVWFPLSYKIDDWKGQVHLVVKATVPEALREALCLELPEDQIPPERRLDLAMARATSLATISEELRVLLLAQGVRVWTVGFHRVNDLLRVLGVGGAEPTVWIEQEKFWFFGAYQGAVLDPLKTGPPSGRPPDVPWYGWHHDVDWIDRILRAATGGVLDEPSILLAEALGREGFGNLHDPADERQRHAGVLRIIAEDPQAAEEGCYADLQWTWRRWWNGDEDAAATPALARAVAALASAEGPARVEVEGIGDFRRERLPANRLPIIPPSPHDGWLPRIADLPEAPSPVRDLVVGETHRYVRHLGPGAW